jgi:hypothetical protein
MVEKIKHVTKNKHSKFVVGFSIRSCIVYQSTLANRKFSVVIVNHALTGNSNVAELVGGMT